MKHHSFQEKKIPTKKGPSELVYALQYLVPLADVPSAAAPREHARSCARRGIKAGGDTAGVDEDRLRRLSGSDGESCCDAGVPASVRIDSRCPAPLVDYRAG